MQKKKKGIAIVLAGGAGTRMGTKVQKQYLHIQGKPVLYYSLNTFENSAAIDEIVVVAGVGQTAFVQKEFVEKYGFEKVRCIVEGGKERYHSVWEGLKAIRKSGVAEDDCIYIHDSARPFLTEEIIQRAREEVEKSGACVVGVPSKDTVKLVDERECAEETPPRERVWIVQTPQVFKASIIMEAYARMMRREVIQVTDDAMAVEQEMGLPVRMVRGSYENIKITTPEDLDVAEVFVRRCFPEEMKSEMPEDAWL